MQIQDNKEPLLRKQPAWIWLDLIPIMLLLGLALRYLGLNFVSLDMTEFLFGWYDKLASAGFLALREPFSNYTPPYLYLLSLAAATHGLLPKTVAIKLISILFDLINAYLVFKILRLRYPRGPLAYAGAAGFLLLPTVLLNSAFWGQADAIYACFILGCIYFLMVEKPLPAMLCMGVAFAFKAQAAFLGPLLLLLVLRRRIPWWSIAIIPAVYFVLMLPAALTGRSLLELLTIYVSQADKYHALSMHGPNLYAFIPNEFYDPVVMAGLIITVVVVLAWVAFYSRRPRELEPSTILLYALVSVAIMPFFLPKMHDRYFYLADVLSFLVAFYFPRLWFIALGYQVVSCLAYSIFLIPSIMPVRRVVTQKVLEIAAIVCTITTLLLLGAQWLITRPARSTPDATRALAGQNT